MELGDYIKNVRISRRFSIRELSSLSGVSHPYISQIENGKNSKPSPDILNKLAEALDVSYLELMRIAGLIDSSTWTEEAAERNAMTEDVLEVIIPFLENDKAVSENSTELKILETHYKKYFGDEFSITGDSLLDVVRNEEHTVMASYLIDELLSRINGYLYKLMSEDNHAKPKELNLVDDLLNMTVKYKDNILSKQDCQRILVVLDAMFPEHNEEE